MKKIIYLALVSGAFIFTSCKKEGCTDATATNYKLEATKDDGSCLYETAVETGTATIKLEHQWGSEATVFNLETEYVHLTTNDTLMFTNFKYYVSNFRLKKDDGTWWSHPESYFLVDLSNSNSLNLSLSGIPEGNYTEISYIMGVDSTRNVSGAQAGALSTVNGMFWSWNTGYIMLKAEGLSPQAGMGSFTYHLGGFSGSNNIVTLKTANLGTALNVTKSSAGKVILGVDPAKLFTTSGSVSNIGMVHMPGANAVILAADFYQSGVFFKAVQN